VNALDMSIMGPTYRAGAMREAAISQLHRLEDDHDVRSVAFEVLGPPRLSKLLYEAELLRRTARTLTAVAESDAGDLSTACAELIHEQPELRSSIISIGIPILLPDGRLLRGPVVKIPPMRGRASEPVEPARMDHWASSGWVDLRDSNMLRWQQRAREIIGELDAIPADDTSSRHHHNRDYWLLDEPLDIGRTVAWVFIREDDGERMK
jgi:hypothetical protein